MWYFLAVLFFSSNFLYSMDIEKWATKELLFHNMYKQKDINSWAQELLFEHKILWWTSSSYPSNEEKYSNFFSESFTKESRWENDSKATYYKEKSGSKESLSIEEFQQIRQEYASQKKYKFPVLFAFLVKENQILSYKIPGKDMAVVSAYLPDSQKVEYIYKLFKTKKSDETIILDEEINLSETLTHSALKDKHAAVEQKIKDLCIDPNVLNQHPQQIHKPERKKK